VLNAQYFTANSTVVLVVMSSHALATQLAYEGFTPSFPVYANGEWVSMVLGRRMEAMLLVIPRGRVLCVLFRKP